MSRTWLRSTCNVSLRDTKTLVVVVRACVPGGGGGKLVVRACQVVVVASFVPPAVWRTVEPWMLCRCVAAISGLKDVAFILDTSVRLLVLVCSTMVLVCSLLMLVCSLQVRRCHQRPERRCVHPGHVRRHGFE